MIDVSTWFWPQYLYLSLTVLSLGFILAKHGEYKPRSEYNFFFSFVWAVIWLFILTVGGFF